MECTQGRRFFHADGKHCLPNKAFRELNSDWRHRGGKVDHIVFQQSEVSTNIKRLFERDMCGKTAWLDTGLEPQIDLPGKPVDLILDVTICEECKRRSHSGVSYSWDPTKFLGSPNGKSVFAKSRRS